MTSGSPFTFAGTPVQSYIAPESGCSRKYGTVGLEPAGTDAERMRILRQACAGLVWSKQMYPYNVRRWLDGDPGEPTARVDSRRALGAAASSLLAKAE